MSKPTIGQLATASGVSLSTINRLLHGTGAVRAETVERILHAAQQIGFYGLGSLRARSRANLPQRSLGFLMQQSHRPLYQMWAERITAAAAARADTIVKPEVRFEDDLSPETVAAHLLDLGGGVDAVAVVTADHPLVSQAIDELRGRDVPVVAYVTDLSAASRAGFVGTDNWKLGRTAAWFISQTARQAGSIVPLIGNHRYHAQDIADASFRSYMREHAPDVAISDSVLTHEDPVRACAIVRRLLEEQPNVRGIFVNGGGISGVLRALREGPAARRRDIRVVCRDIGPETRRGLSDGLVTAALCLPVDHTPRALIDVMLRVLDRRGTSSVEQHIVPFEIVTPESL